MRRLAALFLSAAALTPKAPTPAPPPTLTSEAYRVASAFDKKLSVWYASYYYGLGTAYRRTGEAFLGAVLALYGGAARRCVVNACALAALDARLPLLAVPLGVDVVVAAAAADGGDAPRPTTCNVTMDATTDEPAVLAMDTAGEPFDAADVAAVVAAARTEVTALAAAALAQQAAAS